jgi:hypothetical protein
MKVGLMLSIGELEKLGRPLPWQELREMALAAEERGVGHRAWSRSRRGAGGR